MFSKTTGLCLIVILSFLVTLFPSHYLWAEEGIEKGTSDREKTESAQKQSSTQDQPRILFDSTRYDAGEVWEGDVVSHAFTVKNTGTAELTIKKVKPG